VFDIVIKYAVEGLVDLDVVIEADHGGLPDRQFKWSLRQWLECSDFFPKKGTPSAAGQFLKRPAIEFFELFSNRVIEIAQVEKQSLAQRPQNPSRRDIYAFFYRRLVLDILN